MISTDFHSHILPGMDDGSQTVEESIAMLRLAAEQGITRVIATPHFYPRYDTPEEFLARRDAAMARLQKEMAQYHDLPQVTLGAEVYYFHGMSESEALSQLTIGGKRCILIEMPFGGWTVDMYRELENIWIKRRLIPIVAHIDRYIRPFHTRGLVDRLAHMPVLVQANAEFFLSRRTAAMAMRLLRADAIHLLGSDCHNTTTRMPNLGAALQRIYQKNGDRAMERLEYHEDNFWNAYCEL